MAHLEGDAHKRRDRLSLKTWRPQNSSLPGELGEHSSNFDPVQRWESRLLGERNLWDIDQHRLPQDADDWLRGGAWAKRRLNKAEAGRLLDAAWIALSEVAA